MPRTEGHSVLQCTSVPVYQCTKLPGQVVTYRHRASTLDPALASLQSVVEEELSEIVIVFKWFSFSLQNPLHKRDENPPEFKRRVCPFGLYSARSIYKTKHNAMWVKYHRYMMTNKYFFLQSKSSHTSDLHIYPPLLTPARQKPAFQEVSPTSFRLTNNFWPNMKWFKEFINLNQTVQRP